MWVSEPNWQPSTSFSEPLVPPSVDPDAAPGVQVCVNASYIPYIIGCLMQGVQPVVWDVPDAATLQLTIERWTDLMAMFGNAEACVNPVVSASLDANCGLTLHLADGSTVPVTNWLDHFCSCVTGCTIPPTPPNPGSTVCQQHACNLAGFIASEIIQKAVQVYVAGVMAAQSQVTTLQNLLAALGPEVAIPAAIASAGFGLYNSIAGPNLSDYESAATDPALWSAVTCAIFQAIKGDCFITPANFGQIITNVAAISYAHAEVVAEIAAWTSQWGVTNAQQAQNVGALDVVDCSNCDNTWCFYWDLSLSQGVWTLPNPGVQGTWNSGLGFVSTQDGASGEIDITTPYPPGVTITEVQIRFAVFNLNTIGNQEVAIESPCLVSNVQVSGFPAYVTDGAPRWYSASGLSSTGDCVRIILDHDWESSEFAAVLSAIQMRGTHLNPYGADNCVVGP